MKTQSSNLKNEFVCQQMLKALMPVIEIGVRQRYLPIAKGFAEGKNATQIAKEQNLFRNIISNTTPRIYRDLQVITGLIMEKMQADTTSKEAEKIKLLEQEKKELQQKIKTLEKQLGAYDAFFYNPDKTPKYSRKQQKYLQLKLAESSLTGRAKNILDTAGIFTVAELLAYPPKSLRYQRNVGNKTLTELNEYLTGLGFSPDNS